jgi:hypothetical protein
MLMCHHLNQERENERLFDKEMMVPVIGKYHNDYHSMSISMLLKCWWYHSFLIRLKTRSMEVYRKEINKQFKANLITIEEYEERTKD